ncbi:MAG TPA: rhomboid family intramembrane serine protease [Terriglobales bacterium]|nr:rhomboid family intramembrane serine protease [Terriglobales bacterium]
MIPLRDDAPRTTTPFITYFLVALNCLIFLFEVSLTSGSRAEFVYQFGVVPESVVDAISGTPGASVAGAGVSILSSMFLHASWLHLIANMWALWIFGDNIEDHIGHFRYLALYLASGISASVMHVAFNQGSQVPTVGASGAIAGVMGAYFLLFPSARVLTIMPIVFVFVWLPAWIVLGYWFVAQFLSGAATAIARTSNTGGGVAFWAHVGGFLAGVTLIKLFPAVHPRYKFQS